MQQAKTITITITRSQGLALLGVLVSLVITTLTIAQFQSLRQSSTYQQWQINEMLKEIEALKTDRAKAMEMREQVNHLTEELQAVKDKVRKIEIERAAQRQMAMAAGRVLKVGTRGQAVMPAVPIEPNGKVKGEQERSPPPPQSPQPFILGPPLKEIKP